MTVNEEFTATLAAPSGPHSLSIQYSGDSNYGPSTSPAVTVDAVYRTAMSVTATPTSVPFGSAVTIGVTVDTPNPASNAALKPTGTFSFSANLDGTINNPVTVNATQDSNGNWELQASVSFTPTQSEVVFVTYTGDSNYEGAFGGDIFIPVTIPDFSMSAAASPLVITAGQSGTTTVTITPLTNEPSTVQLSCVSIPGGTCSISPTSVAMSNGAPVTATVMISMLAPSTTTSAFVAPMDWRMPRAPLFPRRGWWMLSLLAGIAAVLMIVVPAKTKRPVRAASGFAFICLLSFAVGCGGGASATSGGGPAPTTTVISTASTKVAQSANLTIIGKVNSSKIVTGTITFGSSDCFGGGTLALQNGMAQTELSGLPVGTCTFVGSYPGDVNNLASQSGPLNITITGTTTQLQVVGKTSTLSHATPVTITIQ